MDYTLIYAPRKTMVLRVREDLSVVVRAPSGYPKTEIDRFVEAHESWIEDKLEKQRLCNARENALTPEQILGLRTKAAAELPPRVEYYAKCMDVVPTGVKITSAKTRFGSCSSQNSLCFSWRLMLYPPQAIDYVVVHELAHIREKNHSPAFYDVVSAVLPDYRQLEELLKTPPM